MKQTFLFILCLSAKILLAQDIVFRTSVENMRLREQPNLDSKVIGMIPKGERLQWSGIRSEKKITADWKGEKVADYWYKIKTHQDTTAWVFGKGIELEAVYDESYTMSRSEDKMKYQLNNDWIKIEPSDKKKFDELLLSTTKWKSYQIKESEYEKPFSLTYENGKKQDFNVDEHHELWVLNAELPEQGYYLLSSSPCCTITNLVKKDDGTFFDFEFPLFAKNNKTILSPNKKVIVCKVDCEPGGIDGIEFYRFKEKSVEKIVHIQTFPVTDFRFISENSGIAKLRDDTYWKITLK